MNEKPLVSIVILSYNRCVDLCETLNEIKKIDYCPLEIIVVDNNSNDQTVTTVARQFPEVNLIPLKKNLGVAAYNQGFSVAKGEYVVILDDDSFPEKRAILRMVELFKANPAIALIAFEVRNYARKSDFVFQTDLVTENITLDYQVSFNGAGAGIRRAVLLSCGGYEEDFFLYWNEQDLALKILDAGYQIISSSQVIAFHKLSAINRVSERAPFYYTRNLLWLIWKHFPAEKLFLETLKVIYLIFISTFEQKSLVYLRALLQALYGSGKILKKRKVVKRKIVSRLRLTYRIAFNYFR